MLFVGYHMVINSQSRTRALRQAAEDAEEEEERLRERQARRDRAAALDAQREADASGASPVGADAV